MKKNVIEGKHLYIFSKSVNQSSFYYKILLSYRKSTKQQEADYFIKLEGNNLNVGNVFNH